MDLNIGVLTRDGHGVIAGNGGGPPRDESGQFRNLLGQYPLGNKGRFRYESRGQTPVSFLGKQARGRYNLFRLHTHWWAICKTRTMQK